MKHLSESQFQSLVMKLAKQGGWLATHSPTVFMEGRYRTAVQGDRGFPDTVLAHPELKRCIFAELKAKGKKTTADQDAWIDALVLAGMEVYVWWPDEIDDIEELLIGHLKAKR